MKPFIISPIFSLPGDAVGRCTGTTLRIRDARRDLRASVIGRGPQGGFLRLPASGTAGGAALVRDAHLTAELSVPETGHHDRDQHPYSEYDRDHHDGLLFHAKKLPILR